MSDLYLKQIQETDPEVFSTLKKELERQQNQIELIASENIASLSILNAQGSVMTNKYAEGYSGKRYYGGCEYVDQAEDIALERVKKLFECKYANLQPHSGAQANQAVFLALLQPHDTILGMSLASGGHLTHGAKPNLSGKWFNAVQYGVKKDGNDKDLIDYDEVESLALEHKPKMIIAGASAYPRVIDWKKFREIADKVGAYFLVDMAHYSGLVAGKHYPNPIEHAHVVTSTTHKTLRGPRGGIILARENEEIQKAINKQVFPGTQGGPLMHVIAAKAHAFLEAMKPEFKDYQQKVVDNARLMAKLLQDSGYDIVSDGTDCHLFLVDLTNKDITGSDGEAALGEANITLNKNSVPNDTRSPMITSGLRIGTPAITTRGFGENEIVLLVEMIDRVLSNIDNTSIIASTKADVKKLCERFPVYIS